MLFFCFKASLAKLYAPLPTPVLKINLWKYFLNLKINAKIVKVGAIQTDLLGGIRPKKNPKKIFQRISNLRCVSMSA